MCTGVPAPVPREHLLTPRLGHSVEATSGLPKRASLLLACRRQRGRAGGDSAPLRKAREPVAALRHAR